MSRHIASMMLLVGFVLGVSLRQAAAQGFRDAADLATERVVKLYGLGAGQQEGYGSGVVVSPDGLVVTVLSLLIESEPVRATDYRGRKYEADVIYRDRARQLALLQLRILPATGWGDAVALTESLPFFEVNVSPELNPGDWVIAACNAFKVAEGDEPVSITHGVFSARIALDARRRVKDFPYKGEVLVIDAITSNPGGPGGVLVNLDGDIVGILGRFVESNFTNTHFNYAMPMDVVSEFMREAQSPELQAQAAKRRIAAQEAGPLDVGIRMAKTGYQQTLPFVERVKRVSRAAKAGVRKNDLILSVNGKTITSVSEFDDRMTGLNPQVPIDMVIRRGKKRIVTVRLEGEKSP